MSGRPSGWSPDWSRSSSAGSTPSCLSVPAGPILGGATAGYIAGRRGWLAGLLMGAGLLLASVVAILYGVAYLYALSRAVPQTPLSFQWRDLLPFAAIGAVRSFLLVTAGGALGGLLRRAVQRRRSPTVSS